MFLYCFYVIFIISITLIIILIIIIIIIVNILFNGKENIMQPKADLVWHKPPQELEKKAYALGLCGWLMRWLFAYGRLYAQPCAHKAPLSSRRAYAAQTPS